MSVAKTSCHSVFCNVFGAAVGLTLGGAASNGNLPLMCAAALVGMVAIPRLFRAIESPKCVLSQWDIRSLNDNVPNQGTTGKVGNGALRLLQDEEERFFWNFTSNQGRQSEILVRFERDLSRFTETECFSFFRSLPPDGVRRCFQRVQNGEILESFSPQPDSFPWRNSLELFADSDTRVYLHKNSGGPSWFGLAFTECSFRWHVHHPRQNRVESFQFDFHRHVPPEYRITYLKDFSLGRVSLDPSKRTLESVTLRKVCEQSHLDPRSVVDRDRWAVTLIDTGNSSPDQSYKLSCAGHAMIVIEGVRNGNYFQYLAHLTAPSFIGSGEVVLYDEDRRLKQPLKYIGKSPTFLRERHEIQRMLDRIREQRGQVLFDFRGSDAFRLITKRAHNCTTWAVETLKFAGIRLESDSPLSHLIATLPSHYTSKTGT